MESIIHVQKALYVGKRGCPPLLPHGDDCHAIRPTKRRKVGHARDRVEPTIPWIDPRTTSPRLFPASQLPGGFPPDLAFRAMACYATLRTLSIPLRLSPFHPTAFLRALYLPFPNRLMGRIHVALLRILLRNLHMGYHWGDKSSTPGASSVVLPVTKRRRDGLRYPLRGTDNLQFLDSYTWPVFFDDYCHLTADILYDQMYSDELFLDFRSIDTSQVKSQRPDLLYGDDDDEEEEDEEDARRGKQPSVPPPRPAPPSNLRPANPLILGSDVEDDETEETETEEEYDEDDNDAFIRAWKRTPPPSSNPSRRTSARLITNVKETRPTAMKQTAVQSESHLLGISGSMKYQSSTKVPQPKPMSRKQAPLRKTEIKVDTPNPQHEEIGEYNAVPDKHNESTSTETPKSLLLCALSSGRPNPVAFKDNYGKIDSRPDIIEANVPTGSATDESHTPTSKKWPASKVEDLTIEVSGTMSQQSFRSVSRETRSDIFKVGVETTASRIPVVETLVSRQCIETPSSFHDASLRAILPVTCLDSTKETPANAKFHDSSKCRLDNPELTSEGRSLAENLMADSAVQTVSSPSPASVREPPQSFVSASPSSPGVEGGAALDQKELCLNGLDCAKASSGATEKNASVSNVDSGLLHRPSETYIGQDSKAPPTSIYTNRENERKINSFLRGYFRDEDVSQIDFTHNDSDDSSQKSTSSLRSQLSVTRPYDDDLFCRWPQFRALQRMRSGDPYHHLPLTSKLDVLEFLVDELLTIDFIASEIAARDAKTECFSVPYAKLPSPAELDNMENEDECGICRQEGDLLCCDGCPRSYHRTCVGLPLVGGIPEGKWYCPECRVIDPALLGPLKRGRKSNLPWCDSVDLDKASTFHELMYNDGSDLYSPFNISAFDHAFANNLIRDSQFLYVHGFVFRRDNEKGRQDAPIPLSEEGLISHLTHMGLHIASSWPLAQIVMTETSLRQRSVIEHATDGKEFLRINENCNPTVYDNKYQAAPLIPLLGKPAEAAHTYELEVRCHSVTQFKLWDCFRSDFSEDNSLRRAFQSSLKLFNPYELVQQYMHDLHQKLMKACLLDETWGAAKPGRRCLKWKSSTSSCKSLKRLARILVNLIDSAHPRVFLETWLNCATTKPIPSDSGPEDPVSIRSDTDPKNHSRRRSWIKCPTSAMPALLAREGRTIEDWIRENFPDLTSVVKRNKRKRAKAEVATPSNGFTALDIEAYAYSSQTLDIGHDHHIDHADNQILETDNCSNEPPTKRLRARRSHNSVVNGQDNAVSYMCDFQLLSKQKMAEVIKELDGSSLPEICWPIAGRKLFPPAGNIPFKAVRYLGRNAAGLMCPLITYKDGFEVGQVALCHVWRKSMLNCKSFEEFLMLIRILEAHLDATAIRKCTTFSQNFLSGKSKPKSEILCKQRDIGNGHCYYLVMHPKVKLTANWVNWNEVDLNSLVVYNITRQQIASCASTKRSLYERTKELNGYQMLDAKKSTNPSDLSGFAIRHCGQPAPTNNFGRGFLSSQEPNGHASLINVTKDIRGEACPGSVLPTQNGLQMNVGSTQFTSPGAGLSFNQTNESSMRNSKPPAVPTEYVGYMPVHAAPGTNVFVARGGQLNGQFPSNFPMNSNLSYVANPVIAGENASFLNSNEGSRQCEQTMLQHTDYQRSQLSAGSLWQVRPAQQSQPQQAFGGQILASGPNQGNLSFGHLGTQEATHDSTQHKTGSTNQQGRLHSAVSAPQSIFGNQNGIPQSEIFSYPSNSQNQTNHDLLGQPSSRLIEQQPSNSFGYSASVRDQNQSSLYAYDRTLIHRQNLDIQQYSNLHAGVDGNMQQPALTASSSILPTGQRIPPQGLLQNQLYPQQDGSNSAISNVAGRSSGDRGSLLTMPSESRQQAFHQGSPGYQYVHLNDSQLRQYNEGSKPMAQSPAGGLSHNALAQPMPSIGTQQAQMAALNWLPQYQDRFFQGMGQPRPTQMMDNPQTYDQQGALRWQGQNVMNPGNQSVRPGYHSTLHQQNTVENLPQQDRTPVASTMTSNTSTYQDSFRTNLSFPLMQSTPQAFQMPNNIPNVNNFYNNSNGNMPSDTRASGHFQNNLSFEGNVPRGYNAVQDNIGNYAQSTQQLQHPNQLFPNHLLLQQQQQQQQQNRFPG